MDRSTRAFRSAVGRAIALGLVLLSFPIVLVVDLYLTPWRLPTTVLYAIPIMLAARLLGPRTTVGAIVAALGFSVVDSSLAGVDPQTAALEAVALATIGLLSVLWAGAERHAAALAAERERLHTEEQRRAVELEESRARLLEFFSLVAHDLQSPLAVISAYAQMISRYSALPAAQQEKIAHGIRSSTQQVVRLANDLLDASRIGAGRFEVEKDGCDLVALCREAVEQWRPTAARHDLILETSVDRLEIPCDAGRLVQAIGNLIGNAIKFSPEGGEVRVTVERVGDRARVAVIDRGIGIAPEDVSRLFQPYVRLKRAPEAKGQGLGLYIVRGIVEAHGGCIAVQSELGEGSTFLIDLPVATADSQDPPLVQVDQPPGRPDRQAGAGSAAPTTDEPEL